MELGVGFGEQEWKLVMHSDEQRRLFREKAIEAEKEAQVAQAASIKESWLKIAATYRALAGGDEVQNESQ